MFKLFVRWNTMSGKDCHEATLDMSGRTILSCTTSNTDHIYGWCQGVVDGLRYGSHEIEMPNCLAGWPLVAPDMTRQD